MNVKDRGKQLYVESSHIIQGFPLLNPKDSAFRDDVISFCIRRAISVEFYEGGLSDDRKQCGLEMNINYVHISFLE